MRQRVLLFSLTVALLWLAIDASAQCTDPYQPNDAASLAWGPVPSGTRLTGKICFDGDSDWFKANITGPGTLRLYLWVPGTVDYELALYDSSLNTLVRPWVGYTRPTEIIYQIASAGTYYFQVYGYPGNPDFDPVNPYTLDYTFSPGQSPIPYSAWASLSNGTDVSLTGRVNPNGLATSAWFDWGTDASMTNRISTTPQNLGSGTSVAGLGQTMINLSAGATYYYRVVGQNSAGTVAGSILSIVIPVVTMPTASTMPASNVGATSATFNATVNPNGISTAVWFEYSTDAAMATWKSTDATLLSAGSEPVPVSLLATGLQPSTVYYYRVTAAGQGTIHATSVSFSTAPDLERRHVQRMSRQ